MKSSYMFEILTGKRNSYSKLACIVLCVSLVFYGCSSETVATQGNDAHPGSMDSVSQDLSNDGMLIVSADGSDERNSEFGRESFTTKGKPTTTIETPWGPKEVYDPTQDSEIREDFKIWYNHPELISYNDHITEMYYFYEKNAKYKQQIIRDARRIQALDYARHQCMRQTYLGGVS